MKFAQFSKIFLFIEHLRWLILSFKFHSISKNLIIKVPPLISCITLVLLEWFYTADNYATNILYENYGLQSMVQFKNFIVPKLHEFRFI